MSAQIAVSLLTATAVILRAEVVLLLVPIGYQLFTIGSITCGTLMRTACFAGLVSVGEHPRTADAYVSMNSYTNFAHLSLSVTVVTVLLDSYFWSRGVIWPELHVLNRNIRQVVSNEWGVSSPLYSKYRHVALTLSPALGIPLFSTCAYLTSDLTKLLLSSLPLSFFSLFHTGTSPGLSPRNHIRSILFPHIAFLTLMSALGHKHWSSFVYIVPVWNVAAAKGAQWL